MTTSMKVLSTQQPWCWAIMHLDKRIENRTRIPPRAVIGQTLALHASLKEDTQGRAWIQRIAGVPIPAGLPHGCIVATFRLIGWVDGQGQGYSLDTGLLDLPSDKWFFGPFGWLLDEVQVLRDPIPARGALYLWNWTPPESIVYI